MEKRSSGGKSIGRGWNGRACWAKTNVASKAGGTGFSMNSLSRNSGIEVRAVTNVEETK